MSFIKLNFYQDWLHDIIFLMFWVYFRDIVILFNKEIYMIHTINLSDLSLAQLNALKKRVEKQIKCHKEENIKMAKIEAIKAAKKYGVTFNDLINQSGIKKRTKKSSSLQGTKISPKYVSPDSSSLTWSGRGRKPKWVKEALEKGAFLSDLLIR